MEKRETDTRLQSVKRWCVGNRMEKKGHCERKNGPGSLEEVESMWLDKLGRDGIVSQTGYWAERMREIVLECCRKRGD